MRILASLIMGVGLVVLLLGLLVTGSTSANPKLTSCQVKSDGTGSHLTIQDAVEDVNCEIVNLGEGSFNENVVISRTLIIQGQGAASTTVDGNQNGSVFTIEASAEVTLTSLNITNGYAEYGGGGIRNQGYLTLIKTTISGNGAGYMGCGGGIYNNGALSVIDGTINNNSSDAGGGICQSGTSLGNVSLYNSTISGNLAGRGGGISSGGGGSVVLNNCTVSDNNASDKGGGFLLWAGVYGDAILFINNSTVSGNTAGNKGGGILNEKFNEIVVAEVILKHSILSGNSAGSGSEIENSATVTSSNYNLFGHSGESNNEAIVGFSPSDGDITATSDGTEPTTLVEILNTTLTDNGGATKTLALLPGSPAIDVIDDAFCPLTDQRGVTRPQDGDGDGLASCDIGAFEYGQLTMNKSGPNVVAAGEPVIYTLTVTNNLASTLTSVVITDALPANANYVSGGTLVGDIVSWTVASLPVGETISRHFVITATKNITNSDYQVSAGEDLSAVGRIPVVTVVEYPITDLAATNDSPTVLGKNTTLTAAMSTGSNVTYSWAFGDGEMGIGSAVAHTYPAVGIYTATVTATNSVSADSATTIVTITEPDRPIYLPFVMRN